MQRIIAVAFVAIVFGSATALAGQTRNVVLVISDGVRWQEVFSGADPVLLGLKERDNPTPEAELRRKYWSDDPRERRRLLFPFLWNTVATKGQIYGNRTAGSSARVTNLMWFSYPGYNEMASGIDDPRIRSNRFGPNPNVTVFEWLNTLPRYRGQVEIFGTWGAFHDIFNEARSRLPVRAGENLIDPGDAGPCGQLLEEVYRTTTWIDNEAPPDSLLHMALREHLSRHQPRVLFVGYGDTDTWAHAGRYDAVLQSAHSFDAFVADLWQELQSLPAYRDTTTLIISTDHGRGDAPVEWKDHGAQQRGSDNVWIAVLGPDTAPLGERTQVGEVTQAQIAGTIAALLGEDFRRYKPQAAAPITDVLGARR